jgi:rhodanese-related sulfurtransferase
MLLITQVDFVLALEDITPTQALELLEDPDVVLLDVRTEEEYIEAHIENSINIPLDTLESRLDELDLRKPIIVYSQSGERSQTASYVLAESGFLTVYNMVGGLNAWLEEGFSQVEQDISPVIPVTAPDQLPIWVPFTPGATSDQYPMILPKSEDTTGICIDSSFPGMFQSTLTLDKIDFDMIDIPYIGYTTQIGEPMVPMVTRFVEVPLDVNARVEIKFVESQILEDFLVMPFQEPLISLADAKIPEFTINEAMYRGDDFYPYMYASIEGENADEPIIIRGRRLVPVNIFPVQFNPVKEQIRVCSRIEVRINFDEPSQVVEIPESKLSLEFEDFFKQTVLNYQKPVKLTEKKEKGCDYLIITFDDFYKAAMKLSAWKIRKGLLVEVVNTTQISSTGLTAQGVANYIQNAYDTWNPAPTYVVLLGDSEFIPTHYELVHPEAEHGGFHIGTDLFHFTVDGQDWFPDIFYGRISVDTLNEANIFINKILEYEKNPPNNPQFYQDISAVAQFEDGTFAPLNGREDVPFFSRADQIRFFLRGEGYDVDRLYWDDNPGTPPSPSWYYNGTNLPAALNHPGYPWDFDAGDINNAINNGRFLVYHIDHGQSRNFWNHVTLTWGADDGWHRPSYNTTNLAGLTNGGLQPVVISIDCNVGWFDGEIDQTDDGMLVNENNLGFDIECFSEEITRRQNSGAVAAIGSTRISYVFANDDLIRGLIDAVWSDYDVTTASGGLYKLGQILMYGKSYVANQHGYNDIYTNTTYNLYHLFGDPEMDMWTDEPQEFHVHHPVKIGAQGLQSFMVTVTDSDTGSPVHHAKVCLQKDNQLQLVSYTDPYGIAYFDVHSNTCGNMNITVTKHNYRPYLNEIELTSWGATLTVSPLSGPPNINAVLTGNNFFESETVDIYFGGNTISTTVVASGGAFTHSYTVPAGTIGPLHVFAVGRTSERVAICIFRRLPDQPLPDPYSYCQWDPSTYHLNPDGGDPRWNSPCIQLYDDATSTPVSSNNLRVGTTYRVTATIYNDATVDAVDTLVVFEWAPFGVGQERIWRFFGDDKITVPSGGSETAETRWTPDITGHSCIVAKINHQWDENLDNNKGQENTAIHPVTSPGSITFDVYNPTGDKVLPFLRARQLDSEELWETEIRRDPPQIQGPGEKKTVTLYVNPPVDIPVGEKQTFTVSGYIDDELIGGIEVEVVKMQKTGLTCTVTPKAVSTGEPVSISGSLTPILPGAKIVITIVDPDGDISQRIPSIASDGTYTETITPSLVGTWKVNSTWMGDDTRMASSSTEETFNVEEVHEQVPEEEDRCIIATATYGSELTPNVQFLRGFRDNYVLNTYAGKNFMTFFNTWYYSFSPKVASAISTHNTLRSIMKILLYPLIGILHVTATIFNLFGFYKEFAIIISGLVASSLIGIIYSTPFNFIIHFTKKIKVHHAMLRIGTLIWGISLAGIIVAEIIKCSSLMMFSTAIFVLITMILATLSSAKYIQKYS